MDADAAEAEERWRRGGGEVEEEGGGRGWIGIAELL